MPARAGPEERSLGELLGLKAAPHDPQEAGVDGSLLLAEDILKDHRKHPSSLKKCDPDAKRHRKAQRKEPPTDIGEDATDWRQQFRLIPGG
jgi:hypothetical protein